MNGGPLVRSPILPKASGTLRAIHALGGRCSECEAYVERMDLRRRNGMWARVGNAIDADDVVEVSSYADARRILCDRHGLAFDGR